MEAGNIFDGIPIEIPDECFDELLAVAGVRIERIVSDGHASPDGFWYDQESSEWVILLKGSAGLRLEDQDEVVILKPGDYINIPAHKRHRVEWTDPSQKTVWLAIHY